MHHTGYCCFILIGQHEEGQIEEVARDLNTNWMTAVEMLDDDIYIGADNCCNLFTVCKSPYGWLEPVGEYHLGDVVNRLHHGSLVMHHIGSEIGQFPTVIFGTVNGAIGVIASLPCDLYAFLEKLQSVLVNFVKGVGNLSHAEWRSFCNAGTTSCARNFVDGDLIESFLSLSPSQMVEVAWAMGVPPVELYKKVQELTNLH